MSRFVRAIGLHVVHDTAIRATRGEGPVRRPVNTLRDSTTPADEMERNTAVWPRGRVYEENGGTEPKAHVIAGGKTKFRFPVPEQIHRFDATVKRFYSTISAHAACEDGPRS